MEETEVVTTFIDCHDCGEEYELLHDASQEVVYCSFCGSELFLDEDFDDEFDEELDED